ncbi:Alpha/Beta hydrolase protein [Syncephalis fuscata]|nr:Alpha/Beta hydrolase protein [Syncephalis fuscata]
MSTTRLIQGVCQVSTTRGTKPFNIVYQLHGTGSQHVIFIQGRGNKIENCLNQADFFAKRGYQVCVFDSRGIGQSDRVDGECSIMDMGLDVIELLNHLGWKSNVHLVGMSMGGMIAQLLVIHYPQYFVSVCFTSTAINSHAEYNVFSRNIFCAKKAPGITKLLFPEEWLNAPSKQDPNILNSEWVHKYLLRTQELDKSRIVHQTKAAANHFVSKEELITIRNTHVAVLICTGDRDGLIIPANSEHMARILRVPLKTFKGCGHFINIQEPELYNKMLLEHFQKTSNKTKQPVFYSSL